MEKITSILTLLRTIILCRGFQWLACFGATLLPAHPLRPQANYRIERYDAQNGLQNRWVTAVQQDRQGFIWVALKEGMLARFDGRTFRHFRMSDEEKRQFSGSDIYYMIIDGEQRFLVNIMRQAARFDPATGRFIKLDENQRDIQLPEDFLNTAALRNKAVQKWQERQNPNRLVWTGGEETYTLEGATMVFDGLETPTEIWVATFEGLFKISPRKRLFDTPLARPFDLQKGATTGLSTYGITEAGGWLWFTGDGALWKAPPGQPELATPALKDKRIFDGTYGLSADQQGWLLPGLYNDWLLRLDPAGPARNYRKYVIPQPYQCDSRSHLQLPNGKIWAAMAGGILELRPRNRLAHAY